MSIYLIDYENTKNLLGIDKLSTDDRVIIFYSQKANSLSFEMHKEIISSKAKVEYKLVEVGSQNALDFQLASYLGYLIKQMENEECKFYIVAKDKGYSFVTSFWKNEKSIDIQLLFNLSGNLQNMDSESLTTNTDIKNLLEHSNLGLTDNEVKEIIEIVNKYKTSQAINANLNKLLKDSTKAGAVLKLIKPFINK